MSKVLRKTLNCQILYYFNLTFVIFIVARNRQPHMHASIHVHGQNARYVGSSTWF